MFMIVWCRFTIEFESPTLYVWELQLDNTCRSKGLGKFLMRLAEMLALQNRIRDVCLCVQLVNTSALDFYKKLSYSKDLRFEDEEGILMMYKSFHRSWHSFKLLKYACTIWSVLASRLCCFAMTHLPVPCVGVSDDKHLKSTKFHRAKLYGWERECG